jgi:uncharacterized protein (UPF0333 family)
MKGFNRGQAALEFMMTYGWAILVVLAAIGALSYFGVLNPSRFTPDTCLASSPFSCPGKPIVSLAGQAVIFSIVNGQGYAVNVERGNLSYSVPLGPLGANCNGVATPTVICPQGTTSGITCTNAQLLQPGQGATIVITCSNLANTNVVKGDVMMNYTNPDSKLKEQIIISVTGKPK